MLPEPLPPPIEQKSASLRWTWGVWVVCAVMFLWQPNFRWEEGKREAPYGSDYLQEYVGGRILLSGDGDRLYDADYTLALQKNPDLLGYEPPEDGYYPMVYPPWWYAAVAPLSALPLQWAAPAWLIAVCGVWFFTLRWASRTDQNLGAAMRRSAILLVAAGPLLTTFAMGQKGVLVAAIVLAVVTLVEQKRFRSAGAVCGLLIFKPHLMLLLAGPLVLRFGWPVLVGGLATVLGAVSLSAAIDPTMAGEYFNVVRQSVGTDYLAQGGYDVEDTHNWAGLWSRLLGFGEASQQATQAWTLATLVLMSVVALSNRTKPLSASGWTAILLGVVLASPHFYSYDLAMLVVPCVLIARDLGRKPQRAVFIGLMFWCLLTVLPQLSKKWPDVPVQWSTVVLASLFFVSSGRELSRPDGRTVSIRPRPSAEMAVG